MTLRILTLTEPQKVNIKAKFHYASWFEAGSNWSPTGFEPDSVMEFGFTLVFYLCLLLSKLQLK